MQISPQSLLLYFSICILCSALTTAVPQWHNSTDGRQYLIEGDQKYNWFHAFHECARRNLQLVEIDTNAKNQALIQVLKPIFGNSHNLWLGAMDEYNRDKNYNRPFYWSSSGKPMTFTYWSGDNPDNDRHDEHCVHMWASAANYKWNDHHCDTPRMGFICEDHHITGSIRQMLAQKHKKATETTAKLYEEYHLLQKHLNEDFTKSFKKLEEGETELKELIHNIHTKLEFDITHGLGQHQRELNSVVEDTIKTMHTLNGEEHSGPKIEKLEKELNDIITKSLTKLEYDITYALSQQKRELNSVVDNKGRILRNTNADLLGASEANSKRFAKELESTKSVFNDILRN